MAHCKYCGNPGGHCQKCSTMIQFDVMGMLTVLEQTIIAHSNLPDLLGIKASQRAIWGLRDLLNDYFNGYCDTKILTAAVGKNPSKDTLENVVSTDTTLQQQTISDLMDERDSAAKALKKYGQHSLTCNWSRLGADPCTCGLEEAFENIGAKLE